MGNPLTYRDGMTMTWQNGRELATLTKDGKTISYSYNADGIRTEKNNNGVITKYFYDSNNNLTSLICGDTQLIFYYDVDGQADSFTVYSGNTATRYYYVKNLQGDITKIMTADGAVVANYYYDAYGEILSITDADGDQITDASSVAFLNPLRYRGYVYDDDTGFYYLQSRYYDPITKRFINADDVFYLGVSGNITGYNLFSYCENNPINNKDADGHMTAAVAASSFAASYGLSLGGAALVAKLSAFLASICPYLLIAVAVVVVAYTTYVIAKNVSIRNIMKKIPNKLKTKDKTKVDLSKFNKKLPNGGGWKGPDNWKIVKDLAKHAGSAWKLYKDGKRIATLWSDGSVRGK